MDGEEEEEEYITESEPEEEDEEEEYMTESDEEEDEEVEQLEEEMKAPGLTSWMGEDGITVPGIMCIDDGIIRFKNRCQLDHCSICLKPSTTHGKHHICGLPCGHMYGFSCIKKWLLLSSSSGKCPQCKTLCSFQDVLLLYPPRLCLTAHQKAPSAAFFPFTEQGLLEFKNYEYSRMLDAELLRSADITRLNMLVTKHSNLSYRVKKLARQRDNLLTRAEELEERAECLGLAYPLRRRACALEPRVEALRRRTGALEQLTGALRRRMDALKQRSDAFESRVRFYFQMYREHNEIAKTKHAFEREKKLAEEAAAEAKNKGEKEAEKVAEKKLKDKEKKEKKKKQAFGTVEEKMLEDVGEEPEKVEVKAKPTSKTRERVKSNNYMNYYYVAGAVVVLTVSLAVGYTLYA